MRHLNVADAANSKTGTYRNLNSEFDSLRRELEITSAEIADYAGCTHKLMWDVELGKHPVENWMISILYRLAAQRAA